MVMDRISVVYRRSRGTRSGDNFRRWYAHGQTVHIRRLPVLLPSDVSLHDITLPWGEYRRRFLAVFTYHRKHIFPATVPSEKRRKVLL